MGSCCRPPGRPQTSASTLSNTVVYEVQTGTTLLVNAMLSLIKDSLTLAEPNL